MTTQELIPGLAGIPAAESAISYIDGAADRRRAFEDTLWSLLNAKEFLLRR